ncbi:MAG: superoxide dismutase family protein [Spongiibacteraceae bacterium]|jgi:Cu-Zn family superoxide dismutase|nr:superoxide dismutase family protein [Spongiibacteraceae bacterium]
MRKKNVLAALIAGALLGSGSLMAAELSKAAATFVNNEGAEVGTAELVSGPNGMVITLNLKGLPSGEKAVHIHAVGTCDDHGEGFKHSGGHLNPDHWKHGFLNPEGPDKGDLPNFFVHSDGTARAQMFTTLASLDGSVGGQVLDADGAALVIHEKGDDHQSQPIGGAGDRIACGVIKAR